VQASIESSRNEAPARGSGFSQLGKDSTSRSCSSRCKQGGIQLPTFKRGLLLGIGGDGCDVQGLGWRCCGRECNLRFEEDAKLQTEKRDQEHAAGKLRR